MTDLLDRLLRRERSVADPARIVPRLPSLFEPGAGPPPGQWPDLADGLAETSPQPLVPGTPTVAVREDGGSVHEEVAARSGRRPAAPSLPAPGPGVRQDPGSLPEPPLIARPGRPGTLAAPSASVAEARTSPAGRVDARPEQTRRYVDTDAEERTFPDAATVEPARTSGAAPRAGVLSPPPPLRTLAVPRAPVEPSPAGDGEDTERTVHVTIGRVEIRAVPAPPATPRRTRSRAPSEPTPLDAYLAQRNGGTRS